MDVAKFSANFCHQSIDHPVCKSLVGMHLRWKAVQCRKQHSLPTIESQASAVKRQLRYCPLWKWLLPGAVPHRKSKFTAFVGSLSYVLAESPWETRRMKFWKSYGMICHRKRQIFWISETQTLAFSLQVGISGPPWDLVTTVVALGCSKSRGPSTNGNFFRFCNFSDDIFSLHLGKGCGCGQ